MMNTEFFFQVLLFTGDVSAITIHLPAITAMLAATQAYK
jgi:hypothetical protein